MDPSSTAALRGHFVLDPEVTFLNHGSFGACPAEVLDEQRALRDRIEREPVLFLGRQALGLLDEARGALAAFLGADPAGTVFVPNATTGVNAVLRSFPFAPGDELLITDHGYNACNNAARFVAERAGARVTVAALPFPTAGPDELLEALVAAITPCTRLVLVDHITSPTGLVLPLERIAEACAARGVELLVDGAHAPGHLPLDLEALGARGVGYYTGNCHKWMCTPKGSAFLWVRADRREQVRPTVISHGTNTPRPGMSFLQDEFDWPGTVDPTPWLCIPFAIRFFEGLLPGGWDAVRARNHALAVEGQGLLAEALGIPRPAPETCLGNLASLPLPPAGGPPAGAFDLDPLHVALFEEERIEVPVMTWRPLEGPPRRLLRISAQVYNHRGDVQRLVEALGRLLGAEAG